MMTVQIVTNATFNKEDIRKDQSPTGPIVIAYRGHQSDKDGMGMVYDHLRFQSVTDHWTRPYAPQNVRAAVEQFFSQAVKNHGVTFPIKLTPKRAYNKPNVTAVCNEAGLLVIPGRVRAIEDEPVRLAFETKIIREALNRGQPILAICAGAWRLFDELKDWIDTPKAEVALNKWRNTASLIEVKDHVYSQMIGLKKKDVQATYNVAIHGVKFVQGTHVQKMVSRKGYHQKSQSVNSVHWKAINPRSLPMNVEISAHSEIDDKIRLKNRHGEWMEPTEGSVEAFEMMFGAPVVGIQWHPEAYEESNPSGRLLKAMAKAGDAYYAKTLMLKEFKEHYAPA
jgi:gamma-glutamyl-gamma-aminobutyrate hydrolase PuuD